MAGRKSAKKSSFGKSLMLLLGGLLIVLVVISIALNSSIKSPTPSQKSEEASLCKGERIYGSVEEALKSPDNVCRLELCCQLKEIPPSIGQLKNLKMLKLSVNQLTSLPTSIANLNNLEELDLNWNQLEEFPSPILSLKNLRYLYLTGNKIKKIPSEIKNLVNLKRFVLLDNKVTCLPREIGQLDSLESLEVVGNRFIYLPTDLAGLNKLKKIKVSTDAVFADSMPASLLTEIVETDITYKANIFSEKALSGEGITHLARRSLEKHLAELDLLKDGKLTAKQNLCLEDFLQKKTGSEKLKVGEQREFAAGLMRSALVNCGVSLRNLCEGGGEKD